MKRPLILGSSSQDRQRVLREVGLEFTVMSPDIDEKAIRAEDPMDLVLKIAHAKAAALAPKCGNAYLITADQVVVCNGEILEKPRHRDDAFRMLTRYSNVGELQTVSGIVVTDCDGGHSVWATDVVTIDIAPIPIPDRRLLAEDLSLRFCSGALRIEHETMSRYVLAVRGSIDSVQGMPAKLTICLLEYMGYELF